MPLGKGQYDHLAEAAMESAEARAAIVMILEGKHGSGFSVSSISPPMILALPGILRDLADRIEEDAQEIALDIEVKVNEAKRKFHDN